MLIVDTALEKLEAENKPIRVGMIGAGFMASGAALEMIKYTKGIKLVGISNRNIEKAKKPFEQAGKENVIEVKTLKEFETASESGNSIITTDPMILCQSKNIDVILEMTGNVEFGAAVALETFKNHKHFVSFNAELFGTIGSILKKYADEAGVIFTLADGDQPVVQMNLYRFVKGLGVKPVLLGNIKGLQDEYRNPTTQEGFAKKWGQNVEMVTSFADGSKVSFEQAVVANAIDATVLKRGMTGPTVEVGTKIDGAVNWFDQEKLTSGKAYVDYVVGAHPGPGVFLLGTMENPIQKHYLNLYKLGEGPLYCFYTPYHLCHFEAPTTVARAFIFNDAALTPLGKPRVDVVTIAKKDMNKGETLDGIGGYSSYGVCEEYDRARSENLLPIGLSEGCILKRDIKKDEAITFEDVELPADRLSDKLWNEQIDLYK
jgi:predicted homoserine dehydrogenase-like protein